MRRNVLLGFIVAIVIATAACGGDTSVGEGVRLDENAKATSVPRLGEREATPKPKATSKPAATRPPAQTRAQPTKAPAPAGPAIVIKIRSDNAPGGSQFEPRLARVARGSTVRWQNDDAVPRSVEADDGSFRSPKIPSGGKWDYRAATPGTFNYHDGTRPYAVASLEVS